MTRAGSPRIVLHVGAMKTGTTAVQAALGEHAAALAEAGVLYPCRPSWDVQVRAVRDALDMRVAGVRPGRWATLAERLRDHPGPVAVLSMEFLSFADADQARGVVDSLAPAPVEVVLTLRDPARVLPSAWQEWTQNRGTASWADYLAAADRLAPGGAAYGRQPGTPAARAYGRVLDSDRMLSAWSAVVPRALLHVVTVPAPGGAPDLLWRRFASVVDVDPNTFPAPAQRANESLDYHAAELMWRVNLAVQDHLDFPAYESLVKNRLCKQVLAGRTERAPVPLPESARELALRWARHTMDLVEQVGASVVGNLAELEPVTGRFAPGPVPPTDRDRVVSVAREALTGLGSEPDVLAADADVEAAVQAVAARIHVLAAERKSSRDVPRPGPRRLLRSLRGGRRLP